MQSKAATVEEYLAELPPDRRAAIQIVREVIKQNLDKDYEEGMQYGGIGYYVPHRIFPSGYHCDPKQPLPFAGLGWQKNHMSLGIMAHYGGGKEREWFLAAWAKTGKKLDMGAVCIRFKKIDDLPLEVIGEAIRRIPAKAYIAHYESFTNSRSTKGTKGKGKATRAPQKAPAKKPAKPAKKAARAAK
jgi:hypothetical protein